MPSRNDTTTVSPYAFDEREVTSSLKRMRTMPALAKPAEPSQGAARRRLVPEALLVQ